MINQVTKAIAGAESTATPHLNNAMSRMPLAFVIADIEQLRMKMSPKMLDATRESYERLQTLATTTSTHSVIKANE